METESHQSLRRAVFLDRDNTLVYDPGYLSDPAQVRLLDGVAAALARLKAAGFLLVLVSNQSGVGRGYYTADDVALVQARLGELLAEQGVVLDGAYYCFHTPDTICACRKPQPGMLFDAARDLRIDLARSFGVGDKPGDATAAKRAGCRAALVETGRADERAARGSDLPPDAVLPDLAAAATWILGCDRD